MEHKINNDEEFVEILKYTVENKLNEMPENALRYLLSQYNGNMTFLENYRNLFKDTNYLNTILVDAFNKILTYSCVTVIKILYCGIVVKLGNKILYISKFPPVPGYTSIPYFLNQSSEDELKPDNITEDEYLEFWSNKSSVQENLTWKGGSWGPNNLPLTDPQWLTEIFINHICYIKVIKQGIIKKKNIFKDTDEIILGTEQNAYSCNIVFNSNEYACYITEQPPPQIAIDVLFIYGNRDKKMIKLLRRGDGPNVDMPGKIAPGAGEHVEVKDMNGGEIKIKEGVLRALHEEIGVNDGVLLNSYLIKIGDYSKDGRDPRYWEYSTIGKDGEFKTFGVNRPSKTSCYVLYFESEVEPQEVQHLDIEEINSKFWYPLDQVLKIKIDDWMIFDHRSMIVDTIKILKEFDRFSNREKESFRMHF